MPLPAGNHKRMDWRLTVTENYNKQTSNKTSMEDQHQISGLVLAVLPEKEISAKFKFQEIVIIKDGPSPQQIIFQFRNHRIDLLSGITRGAEVTITFEVNGKVNDSGNEKRWFNTLVGLDINKN